jgi:hypothetical protein
MAVRRPHRRSRALPQSSAGSGRRHRGQAALQAHGGRYAINNLAER